MHNDYKVETFDTLQEAQKFIEQCLETVSLKGYHSNQTTYWSLKSYPSTGHVVRYHRLALHEIGRSN